MISEAREMVIRAVLDGQLSADYLTLDEVQEVEELAFDLAMEKQLEEAMLAGKAVFWGLDGDPRQ
jgi:hypothetical protein